jgi:hypothetical protein
MISLRKTLLLFANPILSVSFRSLFTLPSILSRRHYFASSLIMMGTSSSSDSKYPIYADESLMKQKSHGTCDAPVMKNLRWGCDYETADRICCFNRHYAEYSGYWQTTKFLEQVRSNFRPHFRTFPHIHMNLG